MTRPEDNILHENEENLREKDFYEAHGLISQGLHGEGMDWRGVKTTCSRGVTIGKDELSGTR